MLFRSCFLGGDINRINPAFFQWLDRRVAYCNYRGIVPDIGLTRLGEATLSRFEEPQIRRVWRYVVSRYAAYNVCWVFSGAECSSRALGQIEALAKLTRQIDSRAHPLLTALSKAQDNATWADGILCTRLTANSVQRIWEEDSPLFLRESNPATSPTMQMWETLFQGGAWQPVLPDSETRPLDNPATQALLNASRLFLSLRFSRLSPHPELLRYTEPNSPILVLANPGREYLLLFHKETTIKLDLLEALGKLNVRWYNIKTATYTGDEEIGRAHV